MKESRLHWAIEFHRVLGCHYEPFIIVVIIHRLLLELDHVGDELLQPVGRLDDAIRILEIGEVTLDPVAHCA